LGICKPSEGTSPQRRLGLGLGPLVDSRLRENDELCVPQPDSRLRENDDVLVIPAKERHPSEGTSPQRRLGLGLGSLPKHHPIILNIPNYLRPGRKLPRQNTLGQRVFNQPLNHTF